MIANARERANDNLYGDSGNFARKVVGGIDAYNHKSGDIYDRNGDTMNRQLSSVANKNNVPVSDVAERFANNLRNLAPNLSAKLENNENTMSHVKEFSNPSNPNFEANNVTFPMLLLRNSVLIATEKQVQKADKLELSWEDLFNKQIIPDYLQ